MQALSQAPAPLTSVPRLPGWELWAAPPQRIQKHLAFHTVQRFLITGFQQAAHGPTPCTVLTPLDNATL